MGHKWRLASVYNECSCLHQFSFRVRWALGRLLPHWGACKHSIWVKKMMEHSMIYAMLIDYILIFYVYRHLTEVIIYLNPEIKLNTSNYIHYTLASLHLWPTILSSFYHMKEKRITCKRRKVKGIKKVLSGLQVSSPV